jgi:hypothetical protein
MQDQQIRFEQLEAERLRTREEARAERARMREVTAAAQKAEFDAAQALRGRDLAEHKRALEKMRAQRAWDLAEAHRSRLANQAEADARHQVDLERQRELLDNTRIQVAKLLDNLRIQDRPRKLELRYLPHDVESRRVQHDSLRYLSELILRSHAHSAGTPRASDAPVRSSSALEPPSQFSVTRISKAFCENLDDDSIISVHHHQQFTDGLPLGQHQQQQFTDLSGLPLGQQQQQFTDLSGLPLGQQNTSVWLHTEDMHL